MMKYFPDLDPDEPVAAAPFILPETLVADHGKIFVGNAFIEAAIALGCNILPARPATGVDKSQIERWFGSLNEIMERLPGWVGRNPSERGTDAWDNDDLLLDSEYETILRYWVFARYHQRKHDGLTVSGQPEMTLTPMEAYAAAVARTGFVAVPADRRWEYEVLPTERRVIGAYGVEFKGLTFDDPVLDPYRNQPYPLADDGSRKWPFKHDPRDLRNIFFLDPASDEWHAIPWMHAPDVEVPFPESSLEFLRKSAAEMYGKDASEADLADVFYANVKGYVLAARRGAQRVDERAEKVVEAVLSSVSAREAAGERPAAQAPEDSPAKHEDSDPALQTADAPELGPRRAVPSMPMLDLDGDE